MAASGYRPSRGEIDCPARARARYSHAVLFGGGTKRRQQSDIERAKAFHAEYKARKAAVRAEVKGKRPRR